MQGYTFKVYGLDCAEEVSAIEKVLMPKIKDKSALRFDLLNGKLTVTRLGVDPISITSVSTELVSGWKVILLKI